MENIVRNLGDSPLQPEANYISCLNTTSQYKAPTRNFQMNKVEESVNRTTNCKVSETLSTTSSGAADWASRPRDWSEEVEGVDANAENDLNSSPQHQVATDSTKLSDMKRKHTLRSPQNVCNDVMKYAGIGRGKCKAKSSHLQGAEFDKRTPDSSMLCNNAETNSDLVSTTHQVDTAVVESNSLSSNSPHAEEICGGDASKSGARKFQDAGEGNRLPVQAQLNGAFCLQGDVRARNIPVSNMDHYREYDYKRLPNGIDNFNRGYRHKNFRMNRVPNNNSNPLQYNKGFDNRNFGHRYPTPMQSNVKAYRPVKPHESHYRHDNRRHQQQPSRPPFPVALDKVVYTKHKGIYADREFSVFDVNRNFASQTFSIQNEIGRQMPGSVSYVPQTNVAAFKMKHNASRIVNCDKMLCNKNEPPNNAKTWPSGGACTDSNTSTVSCHNRTVVTPVKSMVSRHCATCTAHPHEKHCPSLKDEDIHNQKKDFRGTCESPNPDHSQTRAAISDKIENIKLNNSPDYPIHNHRIPHNNCNTVLNNERLPVDDQANSNYDFLPSNDVEIKNHPVEKARSCDGKDAYLREKLGFPPAHLRKDLHNSEKTDASPKANSGNVPLSKQSSGDFCTADGVQQNVMFLGDSHYLSSVPHSSYADAIRMSANTMSKVTSCQMSNCVEVSVSKNNEYQDVHEKLHPKIEVEHPNASPQWVRSRLPQVDANTSNLVNVNGIPHQVAPNSHQGVNPRPIAVSLEKPSFYNSKSGVGTGIHVQPPNLSSPERRMLECQYVEEQLSSVLGCKKAGEKLSFLSDLTSGEHSSAYVPVNVRTDSTFSDTSSVCSSMSGTFKGEGQCQLLKTNTPPVIIMTNCGTTEGMSEISFGIEMEEIIKLCGDGDFDTVDSQITFLQDSGFCSAKLPDVGSCETEGLDEGETMHPSSMKVNEENIGEFVVIGNKRLLWQDRVDASKCNMPQIVDFLQESVGEGDGSGKFYTEE